MKISNPVAMLGLALIGVAGKRCRSFWSGSYVHDDGSPLYSGIQRKKYRDVGWSFVTLGVLFFPLAAMVQMFAGEPNAVTFKSKHHAVFMLAIFPAALLSLRHLFSELQDSQLVHAARDEGITDDVFEHDDDEAEIDDEIDQYEDLDPGEEYIDDEPEDEESADVIEFPGDQSEKGAYWA